MADLSEVQTALVARVWGSIYPGGPNTSPVTGFATEVYPGWPRETDLDADMAANPPIVNISIFPEGIERVTTRFPVEWTDQTRGVPTITAAIADKTVTLSGTVTVGQYLSIVTLNKAASYAAVAGDDLPAVATKTAALLTTAGVPATASGPVITIPSAAATDIAARVGAPGTVIREIRRQQKLFRISVWAPTQIARDATASIVDNALAAIAPPMVDADFLLFPDGSKGWLLYQQSMDLDQFETKNVSRRDLCYFCEYATTQTAPGYPITVISNSINSADGSTQGSTVTTNQ